MTMKEVSSEHETGLPPHEIKRKREEELQKIWRLREEDENPLIEEIRQCGYAVNSVYDLVNNSTHPVLERAFTGPYEKAYPVLIKHLDIDHERIIREGIIRALTVKDGGKEVEEALLKQFNSEENSDTKWVLANALKTAMPYHRRKKYPEIARFYKEKR